MVQALKELKDDAFCMILNDNNKCIFSMDRIADFIQRASVDTEKSPACVKKSLGFEKCPTCLKRGSNEPCVALYPVFLHFDAITQQTSSDHVTIAFRENQSDVVLMKRMSAEQAFQSVAILSLVHYCGIGRKYKRFFVGITPGMDSHEMIDIIYRNISSWCDGDKKIMNILIDHLVSEIQSLVMSQIERLKVICEKDALPGAFGLMHTVMMLLAMKVRGDEEDKI